MGRGVLHSGRHAGTRFGPIYCSLSASCSVTSQMISVILSEAKNLGVAGQMLRLPAQHDSSSDHMYV